jgi:hypothetical protein
MSVWKSGLFGRIVCCGYRPQRQMQFAFSMVAKAASRNEPFGISENGVIADTASGKRSSVAVGDPLHYSNCIRVLLCQIIISSSARSHHAACPRIQS